MAILQSDSIMDGTSGMFGKYMVFRRLRGKTIVANRPSPPRKESAQQRANRQTFKEASDYAKFMMLDEERKAYYWRKAKKLKLPNAYTAAIADYMRKIKVKPGPVKPVKNTTKKTITFNVVKKDFRIRKVSVSVVTKTQEVITGDAIQNTTFMHDWCYTFPDESILSDAVSAFINVEDDTYQRIAVPWDIAGLTD